MSLSLKLALGSLGTGLVMGLWVLAAAAVGGQKHKLWLWLGGTAWGALATGLMLTDCLPGRQPGPVSDAAFPIYFVGLIGWPAAAVWGRPRWLWRWLAAQVLMLMTAVPGYLVVVAAALCTLL